MKQLALLMTLVAGCQRGHGPLDLVFAVDPATGVCTPLTAASAPQGWQGCSDPCAGLDERACKIDVRCQAVYHTAFTHCHGVPQLVDPCKALDAASCSSDPRCVRQGAPACALEPCLAITDGDECRARPDCTTESPPPTPVPVANGGPLPRSLPAQVCFPLSGCGGTEDTCLKQHACAPFYDDHGNFSGCGFELNCKTSDECPDGDRCNANGVCVVAGCVGETEAECNADAQCEPMYMLECSPYANAVPVPDSFCGQPGGGGAGGCCGGGGGTGGGCGGGGGGTPPPCEPSFTGCQPAGPVVTGKAVLVRDPSILDDPFWAVPRVLTSITGASDASAVADAWLGQLGSATTVGTQTAPARTAAGQFIAGLPHRSDGLLDATQLGFVPTSLSNRLDLADDASCGEARISYALASGVTDRRHRMTIIVELRQPYDGAGCRTTAQTWVALSQLDGAALQSALQSIYAPLLTPANVKQVRTNEFLVGPQDPSLPPATWELREFHLGSDARLHQALLPLQIDPVAAAAAPDFVTWAQTNRDALAHGTATFPAQYQVPTGTEDGRPIALADLMLGNLVDKSTCAGCHTTATNSAFAHVAERFQGTGRAEISSFLEGELQKRATHLGLVAAGLIGAPLDVRPLH